MLSFRPISRSAPRALSRMTSSSLRQSASISRASAVAAHASRFAALPSSRAAFSSTSVAQKAAAAAAAAGETDAELSAKLESEIQVEEDMDAEEQQPASVKDFLDNSPFELIDKPGQEVVKLVRTFGEEKITITFSVGDISNFDPFQDDRALEDEDELDDEAAQKQQNRSSGSQDEDPDMDDDLGGDDTAAPITLNIVIEKPGKTAGALAIDASAQDGAVVVENMSFFEDATLAQAYNPEAAQRRAEIYPGPPFGSLDEDLQVMMERFLEERGVTQALAVFVPDYVDVKEQREYLRWLNNVKGFIDA